MNGSWVTFFVMVGVLLLLQLWRKQPIGLSLLGGAIAGALVAGRGLPVRHLVEGMFTYLDPILIIFTAMVFMKVITENGTLGDLAAVILHAFGRIPVVLVGVITLFIMFPAMLTGITTTSVLTTGALMVPPLEAMRINRERIAAMVAMVSVMGMLAPPINLLAMLIGQGVDMPYIGFGLPLLMITVPVALIAGYTLIYPEMRRSDPLIARQALNVSADGIKPVRFLPILIVFALMTAVRVWPEAVPDIGIPLIFLIGAVTGLVFGKPVKLWPASLDAFKMALPVLGLLAGVGAFLQVMTLTGVRGLLVVSVLGLPPALKYIGLLVSLPLFGGVSAFASAMVFGVPFLLSLLGGNEIAICAGIAILAGLGDVLPPSAINARFAAQVADTPNLAGVIRRCLPFVLLTALAAVAMIYFAGRAT
jgi:TRAP-type C4-dicarboxylate transport system permease large subunit